MQNAAKVSEGKESAEVSGQTVNVLILDDNNFDRKRLRRIARQTGIEMKFTDTPSLIAFEKQLDLQHFHLVFIDYRLPEGNGLQALRLLRDHPVNGQAAAIMAAAALEQNKVKEAFSAGCTNYIAKDALNTRMLRYMAIAALEASAQGDAENDAVALDDEPPARLSVTAGRP